MKTVCVLDSISRANGGIFVAESRLQQELAHSGVDVRVVGLTDAHTAADSVAWSPLVPVTVPITGPRGFGYAPGMTEAIAQADADLGYLAGLWKYPSVAARRWTRQMDRPLVVAPHGMLDPWALRNSAWKKKLAGWFFQNDQLRRAACLRALCRSEMESMRAYGLRGPVCIIPNGIDIPQAASARPRPPSFPGDRKVLFYLGRLHPKKGLANLITAWSEARSLAKDWILVIAGWDQGGHEADLNRLANDLGVPDASLHFAGPQFGADKEACYRSCDAFILPSFSEGLPMVVLEAWAHGKPVLITDACNLPEGFAAQAALRLQPTEGSIRDGLATLFSMSEADRNKMGARGLHLVEERFAWPRLARDMKATYEWILGGGPKPDVVETG